MQYIEELFSNQIFLTATSGWLIAQLLKTLIHFILSKEFNAERLVGDGGMPSSHSATVSALATSVALECGLGSVEFAIAAMFAIVVMHDAMGVRRETGIQAKLLNEIIQVFEDMGREEISVHDKLKEFVGHTPLQVIIGSLLGIATAFTSYLIFR